ncbi:hypothetical protein [Methylobacillus sp.]|uniref:hypothetical protein n=1 Tax=Methylobacillus sp. TaxID=56818 RepID=UPI0012C5FBA7|nr:hypothetical protein [Methylobacillus sp.]MPS48186.1 hypothetical protein [Methylobacillus sp.]
MLTLNKNYQIMIGLVLAALLIVTRGHHFAAINHLPSASWAVFFLAGVYLRPVWVFPALFGLAAALDFAAVTWGGVDGFCTSPAYGFLIPAYGTLWLGGRWFAKHYQFAFKSIATLAATVVASSFVCHLFSSGGFYFFSGRYVDPTLAEFLPRIAKHYPSSLGTLAFYVATAAIIHIVVKALYADHKRTA